MSVTLSIISIFSFAEEVSCSQWMMTSSLAEYKTDSDIVESCDGETFEVLNHEYAKDKNLVYFKPMPNSTNMVTILKTADSKTFKLLKRCKRYADKNHVFSGRNIVENKDPRTYCY
jgi:hypothetical protein